MASSSLEQTQHILRCLFAIERNIIQVKRKAGIDVIWIIDCKAIQNLFHLIAVQPENFSGADTITVNVAVQ